MNYIVTVYRTTGNQVQRYNASDLSAGLALMSKFTNDRFVHKVELSVILQTWVRLK